MERVNKILNHDLFLHNLEQNLIAEENRFFCKHDLPHFLDVARIGCIIREREQLQLDEELIYAAALLHDLGRNRQYTDGTPHEQASCEIADVILKDCDFSDAEKQIVLFAIAGHRGKDSTTFMGNAAVGRKVEADLGTISLLSRILYQADKASRPCFCCKASAQCNWPMEKRNMELKL